MCGIDVNDSTSIKAPSSCFMRNDGLDGSISGLTIGIPRVRFSVLRFYRLYLVNLNGNME